MRQELEELKGYLTDLRNMEPDEALRWLTDENLVGALARHIERVEEALQQVHGPPDGEVEVLALQLPPSYDVPGRGGYTRANDLAGWINDLPLKDGWVVSKATWSDGKVEILVHHIGAKFPAYGKLVKVEPMFSPRAEGEGSRRVGMLSD